MEPDDVRPLTPQGQRQADGWARRLAGEPVTRLLSSPARRCTDTLHPLAKQTGLPLEVDARLAEGADPEAARSWLLGMSGEVVVCSHGDVVPALVAGWPAERPGPGSAAGRVRCRKGDGWQIQLDGSEWTVVYEPQIASAPDDEPLSDAARVGVLDLGSTSFHLLVADVDSTGGITRVGRERVMLRLGALLADHGVIPAPAFARAVETVAALRADAEEAGAQLLIAVATAALREARNGAELVVELERALGVPVRRISGAQEARLVLGALFARLGEGPEPMLALDLGGGSLELALGESGRALWQTSLPLGVVRLLTELGPAPDPLGAEFVAKLRKRVASALAPHRQRLRPPAHARAVATGGTLRALVRLLHTGDGAPSRELLGVEQLGALAEHLAGLPHDRRLALPRMSRRRVDLLPVGALILSTVCRELGIRRVEPCDWGLREGVLLDHLRAGPAEPESREKE